MNERFLGWDKLKIFMRNYYKKVALKAKIVLNSWTVSFLNVH